MALYRVALRKAWDYGVVTPRKWSTTFFVEAPNATAAASVGSVGWTAILRNSCHERIYCYEAYATDLNPGTTDYAVVSVPSGQQRGTRAQGAGEVYLNKACLAVTIPVPLSRPSRKFWRCGLLEGDVGSGGESFNATLAELVRDVWDGFITSVSGQLRDEDGQPYQMGVKVRLTTREFGRESTNLVPLGPALG